MIKLYDFYQTNCGPCKMMNPSIDRFTKEYEGRVEVVKINIDTETSYVEKYNLMSTPTFVVENEGKEVDRMYGFLPYEVLESFVLKHVGEGQ